MYTGKLSIHGLMGGARFPRRGCISGMSVCVIVIAATITGAIANNSINIQSLVFTFINTLGTRSEIVSGCLQQRIVNTVAGE